jgi:deoxyribose-phosphate aldolase
MYQKILSISKMIDHSLLNPELTDEDLKLMRTKCKSSIEIKAAGKVRTLDDILRVKSLGITRVGATATESVMKEARKRGFH